MRANQFVNRESELTELERWWKRGDPLALVWGRRRVGKTWLIERFASGKRSLIHTGGDRDPLGDLTLLSVEVMQAGLGGVRNLEKRPFVSWDEALDHLAGQAVDNPLLVVLDEFPEIVRNEPGVESILRAFAERRGSGSRLRFVLAGSAVRTMERLAEASAPLYGRFGLRLQVHPFEPHEAARMLPDLTPGMRALVWGLVGGIPLYLSWWDQRRSLEHNIAELVCSPSGRLLSEGQLVLATEGDELRLAGPVLSAVASGRTRFSEIKDAIRTDPSRPLERLAQLRLLERMVPVTEDPSRTRRAHYRLVDNFLAFWFTVIDRHRASIERGLGPTVLPVIMESLDDFMGPRWEEAFRSHVRRLAVDGKLGGSVVAVGRWWNGRSEIDAVVLAGRSREATWLGEAKWARSAMAPPIEAALHRAGAGLPRVTDSPGIVVCARDRVQGASSSTLTITAADVFGLPER